MTTEEPTTPDTGTLPEGVTIETQPVNPIATMGIIFVPTKAISVALAASSEQGGRFALEFLKISRTDFGSWVEACNGKHLLIARSPWPSPADVREIVQSLKEYPAVKASAFIEAKRMRPLMQALKGDWLGFSIRDDRVALSNGEAAVQIKAAPDNTKYPDTLRVLPQTPALAQAWVMPEYLETVARIMRQIGEGGESVQIGFHGTKPITFNMTTKNEIVVDAALMPLDRKDMQTPTKPR